MHTHYPYLLCHGQKACHDKQAGNEIDAPRATSTRELTFDNLVSPT